MANPSRSQKNARTAQSKKPKPKTKKNRHIGLKIAIGIVGFLCIVLLSGIGLFFYYVKDAPELTEKALDATVSSKLLDKDGEIFEDLGAEKREKVAADKIPQELDDAIVSVEDRRFFKHNGVDPVRIAGSALHNLTNKGGLQGGSTLTQQLVKLSFFSTKSSDQTLRRKAQEAWLAIQLEKKHSKQEVLTYYINKVYMANGLYGMETAAETYFGKELQHLSIAQTALLAGMPQAPNSYDPYKHPEAAKDRRDTVLYTMLNNKKISQADYDKAIAEPIDEGLLPLETDNQERKVADNYVKEVIEQVEKKTGKNVYTDGLEIYTNLDKNAQKRLYSIVNGDEYVQYPDEKLQIAATLIDSQTGNVTAQIGGRNIADDVYLGMNRAVNTSRDFGSTVKPITDYGPAFEYKKYSTGDWIDDSRYYYENTSGPKVEVKNWDLSYKGKITLRQALYDSRNVPAVKLFNDVGAENVTKFLKKLGIQYKDIQQANAISSNTETQDGTKYGISTEKMAAAYAAFANGGTYNEPLYINKIKYQDGSEEKFVNKGKKAMEPYTAYMITDILKDVITKGTGTYAQIPNLIQAGKTGTSNYTDDELAKIPHTSTIEPDVMFTGYTTNYALSIWAGYDDRMTPITVESENIAQYVYKAMMSYASENVSNVDWTMPDDVIRIGNELYVKGASSVPTFPSSTTTSSLYSYSTFSETTSSTSSVEESSQEPSASVPSTETPASSSEPVPSSSATPSSSEPQPSQSSSNANPASTPGESQQTPQSNP